MIKKNKKQNKLKKFRIATLTILIAIICYVILLFYQVKGNNEDTIMIAIGISLTFLLVFVYGILYVLEKREY